MSTDATYDVIVVGGGGSGLAAAIEARALGRDVVLLEKNPELGGSTAWSIGSVTASQTPHQARKGIVDNPQDHWRDMAGFNGELDPRDNAALRRVLADAMPDTFRWLLQHGVRFYGPMPEPPHSKPRMHNVLPNSRAFITHLAKAARRAGVTIACGVRAKSLVTEQGRVAAIDCETADGPRRFRARGGIVLATGDFTSDPELKAQFMGPQEAKIDGVNVTATGDGQKLAVALGARIVNGDLALGPELRFVPPPGRNMLLMLPPWRLLANLMAWSLEHMPSALLRPFAMSFVTTALAPSPDLFAEGAILMNKRGERFTDETDKPAYALPDQPDKVAYILLDKRVAALFSGWPHFISTAPGVAYAYVDDYRRTMPWPATGRRSARDPMSRSGRCARCSCMRKAGSRSTTSIACSVKAMRRSPVSMRSARPGRAAYCSRATATISAGRSPRGEGRDGTRRSRRAASYFASSVTGDVTTRNTRSITPVLWMS